MKFVKYQDEARSIEKKLLSRGSKKLMEKMGKIT